MAKVKKLRNYQVNQVNRLIRQLTYNNQAALVSAVGTGKTLVTAIVGSELISPILWENIVTAIET
jgi:superfamily II DNA or RNA helicase